MHYTNSFSQFRYGSMPHLWNNLHMLPLPVPYGGYQISTTSSEFNASVFVPDAYQGRLPLSSRNPPEIIIINNFRQKSAFHDGFAFSGSSKQFKLRSGMVE